MALVPVLITILVIGCFIGVAAKLMNKNVMRKGKYVYSHRVRLVFGGYLAVLIICMVLSNILPAKSMAQLENVDGNKLDQESIELYDAAIAGNINQYDSKFLRKKWDFDYQGEQLKIATDDETFFNITIVVEKKEQNDGQIEAGFYMTRSSVNGLDITKLVQPPQLKLTDKLLLLSNSPKNQIKFAQFANVFSLKQFTEESFFGQHASSREGQSILYLKVPKDLQITDTSNQNLQYVDGA